MSDTPDIRYNEDGTINNILRKTATERGNWLLATFRGKAADELTRLRAENETLTAERDRLREQLAAAQIELESLRQGDGDLAEPRR